MWGLSSFWCWCLVMFFSFSLSSVCSRVKWQNDELLLGDIRSTEAQIEPIPRFVSLLFYCCWWWWQRLENSMDAYSWWNYIKIYIINGSFFRYFWFRFLFAFVFVCILFCLTLCASNDRKSLICCCFELRKKKMKDTLASRVLLFLLGKTLNISAIQLFTAFPTFMMAVWYECFSIKLFHFWCAHINQHFSVRKWCEFNS